MCTAEWHPRAVEQGRRHQEGPRHGTAGNAHGQQK